MIEKLQRDQQVRRIINIQLEAALKHPGSNLMSTRSFCENFISKFDQNFQILYLSSMVVLENEHKENEAENKRIKTLIDTAESSLPSPHKQTLEQYVEKRDADEFKTGDL